MFLSKIHFFLSRNVCDNFIFLIFLLMKMPMSLKIDIPRDIKIPLVSFMNILKVNESRSNLISFVSRVYNFFFTILIFRFTVERLKVMTRMRGDLRVEKLLQKYFHSITIKKFQNKKGKKSRESLVSSMRLFDSYLSANKWIFEMKNFSSLSRWVNLFTHSWFQFSFYFSLVLFC